MNYLEFFNKIINVINDVTFKRLRLTTFLLMGLIVIFNIKGYEVLFSDEPLFNKNGISPFGLLLGVTELAVLFWSSEVIGKWKNTPSSIKYLVLPLVVCSFSFLSYTGINSYLNELVNSDSKRINKTVLLYKNSEELIKSKENERLDITTQLKSINSEQLLISSQLSEKNNQVSELSSLVSLRRQTATNCELVADCSSSVKNFQSQINVLSNDINSLSLSRSSNDKRISSFEKRLDSVMLEISDEKNAQIKLKNSTVGDESSVNIKRASYENIILGITEYFGMDKPNDPFSWFVNFISFLIYPVYFMLNLLLALNTDENIAVRKEREKNKKRRVSHYFKIRLLRKKKATFANLKDKANKNSKRKSQRTEIYRKCIRYFRVWAHRRTKVLEVPLETIKEIVVEREIEKIVEVEVEVEKEVEVIKEIVVEKEVEIVKEVDRIIEVPTEVEVIVEKTIVKTVEVPYFIKDPQVVIHERIIPVPENVTGAELEEILNAQPELNTDARSEEERFNQSGEGEGYSETEQEKERERA